MSKYLQDEVQLQRLKTGNSLEWRRFFDAHSDAFILFTMKHFRKDKEAAIELYQDAIIILHRNVTEGKLTPPLQSALRTYLFGIAKNLSYRTSSPPQTIDDIPEIPVDPIAEKQEERLYKKDLVKRLLKQLSADCRELLTLIFLKGYAKDAVAEEMDLPTEGAVRKRQHDCLKKLRKLMG